VRKVVPHKFHSGVVLVIPRVAEGKPCGPCSGGYCRRSVRDAQVIFCCCLFSVVVTDLAARAKDGTKNSKRSGRRVVCQRVL
jgi:hypothetical protein